MLNSLGVSSCSHLCQQMALLSCLFSETAWHHFLEVALGLGSTYIPRYDFVTALKLNTIRNKSIQSENFIIFIVFAFIRHEERKSMSTERYQ